MEKEFKVGDKVIIFKSGCNNSALPEYQNHLFLDKSDKVYTIEKIEDSGSYYSPNIHTYTIFLEGRPIWANHCKLIKETIIDTYEIY